MVPHFDWLARCYDLFIPPQRTRRLERLLRLTGKERLLDAGGGTGRIAGPLAPLAGQLIVGDLSAPMLGQALRKRHLTAVQCLTGQLPFADNAFDRVLVVDALHHFQNQKASLADLVRVLKPGGRLVIEEPDIGRWPVKLLAMAETLALMRSRFLTGPEIRKLLSPLDVSLAIEYDHVFMWVTADKPRKADAAGRSL